MCLCVGVCGGVVVVLVTEVSGSNASNILLYIILNNLFSLKIDLGDVVWAIINCLTKQEIILMCLTVRD